MKSQDSATLTPSVTLRGLVLAGLGVVGFSFTFPATALALEGFGPYLIGIGRAAVAGALALGCLVAVRARLPDAAQWRGIALVVLGVVFGFPVLTALALANGSASSHAAVVIGLLPAATAGFAALRVGERPPMRFWLAAGVGAVAVTVFALASAGHDAGQGAGQVAADGAAQLGRTGAGPVGFAAADLLLFGALVAGGLGYAEGGRLARAMPGWRVIAWALVLSLPVTVPVTAVLLAAGPVRPDGTAALGFAYVALVSMFLAFFAWYRGLADAGVARGSQLQLAQPLLTVGWSVLLLGESVGAATLVAALVVVVCVGFTQRSASRGASRRPRRRV